MWLVSFIELYFVYEDVESFFPFQNMQVRDVHRGHFRKKKSIESTDLRSPR
jgi:hypothetical protein